MLLVALMSDLVVANMIVLVTWPFSLLKFSVRTAFVVLLTCIELVRAAVNFHVNLIYGFIMWTTALVTLPVRVLSALHRERQLEQLVHVMQSEMDHLVWEYKQVQEVLHTAVKERKMLELILTELEDEHDMAISTIEELEEKLQLLKHENLRLMKEIKGKSHWKFRSEDQPAHVDMPCESSYDTTELNKFLKSGLVLPEVLGQRRYAALRQSFFSAILSLLVGIVIWESEDSCTPLVLALFAVVFMSLKSVVQFFSTIKNKPASDAVALMSFNWFVLGTLASPALPKVARALAPVSLGFLSKTTTWLGFFFS